MGDRYSASVCEHIFPATAPLPAFRHFSVDVFPARIYSTARPVRSVDCHAAVVALLVRCAHLFSTRGSTADRRMHIRTRLAVGTDNRARIKGKRRTGYDENGDDALVHRTSRRG